MASCKGSSAAPYPVVLTVFLCLPVKLEGPVRRCWLSAGQMKVRTEMPVSTDAPYDANMTFTSSYGPR